MELMCWHCGGNLREVPRPIRPSMRCPHCRADLHTCRMCRHYDTRYIGHCSHEQADKVLDKEQANYCTHFAPAPNAHARRGDERKDRARQELADLFDEGKPQSAPQTESVADALSASDRARREAEGLFDAAKLRPKRDDG